MKVSLLLPRLAPMARCFESYYLRELLLLKSTLLYCAALLPHCCLALTIADLAGRAVDSVVRAPTPKWLPIKQGGKARAGVTSTMLGQGWDSRGQSFGASQEVGACARAGALRVGAFA